MSLSRLPERRKGAKIDLSLAIINIVLLLILFFLIAGQLVAGQRFAVDPARTRDLALEILPSPVLSHVATGQWELDGAAVDLADLPDLLAGETVLHILADREAVALEIVEFTLRDGLEDLELRLVTVRTGAVAP